MLKAIYPVIGNQIRLPFYLTGIGVSDPEYSVDRPNGLISHQFLFTLNGLGTLEIDGKKIPQKAGSLFYLSPSVPHKYYPAARDWTTYWIVFRGEHLNALMTTLGFERWNTADNLNLQPLISVFRMIYASANNPADCGEACSQLLYTYLLSARKLLTSAPAGFAFGNNIKKAVMLINSRYFEDITLGQLAVTAGVSCQHFCRSFRAQIGMRPMEYLARKRIAEARLLLCNSKECISEIGKKVGYPDLTYFGMVFRKFEGISPSEYRRLKTSHLL